MKKAKKTGFLLLIFAVLLGGLAGFLTLRMINNSYKEEVVLIAKTDIEEGDPLTSDLFETKTVHPSGKPETSVIVEEVDYNGMVSARSMLKGDILREEHFIKISDSQQELPLISTRIKSIGNDNLIAAEIPVESIKGILNGVKQGDKVTVVSVRENKETKEIVSSTILVNIEVIAVKGDTEKEKNTDVATGGTNEVLAVALTADEFKTLSLARDIGNIHIAVQPLGVILDNSLVDSIVAKKIPGEVSQ